MRYRLERVDELTQSIWDDVEGRRVIRFMETDYAEDFSISSPKLIVDFLNNQGGLDKYDAYAAIKSLLSLSNRIALKFNEMSETIEGLKEGGTALNYILPKPCVNYSDCITNSELYRIQYKMAKEKWDAYYKRFYLKRPGETDEIVARAHRSDLHHMRSKDGRWYFKCTMNNKTTSKFLGENEEEAKKKRDSLLKELGYHG